MVFETLNSLKYEKTTGIVNIQKEKKGSKDTNGLFRKNIKKFRANTSITSNGRKKC